MSDLEPLLTNTKNARLRALLDAGQNEQPPPELSAKLVVGLGLGTSALVVSSAAAGAASLAPGKVASSNLVVVVIKWLAIGAVGGGLVAGGASAAFSPSPSPAVSTPALLAAPSATHSQLATPAIAALAASTKEAESQPEPAHTAGRAAPAPVPSSSSGQLGREVRLIDAARAALAQGNVALATSRLAEYRQTASTGVLDREARVLQIEVVYRSGDRAKATALARAYEQEYPNDAHVARLRALTGLE